MLPLSLGLDSPLLLPPRSPSICVAPQGFSYQRCRWLSSLCPVAGRPLTQRKETRKVAVLWELYPQYPGLIPSENLSVPRPVFYQSAHQTQVAAGVCVPCILSKHVTCSRSPGGSCRGSPVGLRRRCTSHVLADHGQGLAIYPVLGMQFHPLFFIDACQGRCLVGPTLQREKLCKCSGLGFGCRMGWTCHLGHLSNAGEIHGHRLAQPPGALPA